MRRTSDGTAALPPLAAALPVGRGDTQPKRKATPKGRLDAISF
jgi:hypothetical protein